MIFKKEFPSKSLNLQVLVVNWYVDDTFIKTSNKLTNLI